MSRGTALRRSMAMLIMVSGAVLGASWPAAADWGGVWVRDSAFAPQVLSINPDDRVAFGRDTGLTHSITWDSNVFPEQELSGNWRYALTPPFPNAGRYDYHCKYHGGPGGKGMSGTVVVGDPAPPPPSSTTTTTEPPPSSSTSTSSTTTTTRPPTTTTTRPPTTTTTEPPTTTTAPPPPTTTEPPTTTTTQNVTVTPRPPTAPSALTSDSTAPRKPPAASTGKKKAGAGSSTTSTSDKGRAAPAAGIDVSTTTSPQPELQPEEVAPPVVLEPVPVVEPSSPATEPGVQTLDDLALGRLADREEKPPRRDRSGFVIGAGIGLAAFLVVAAAWAWYHRPSRYLPA